MTSLAFDFLASPSPTLVDAKRMAGSIANRPESLTNRLETPSRQCGFGDNGGPRLDARADDSSRRPTGAACGEDEVSRSSPQAMMRELGELIAPRQPAKVLYPLLHADLLHYAPGLSLRRVRALYNGEVPRLWHDEALAIRMALSRRRNAAARRAFARAAAEMTAALAAQGVPFSADQFRVVSGLSEGEHA